MTHTRTAWRGPLLTALLMGALSLGGCDSSNAPGTAAAPALPGHSAPPPSSAGGKTAIEIPCAQHSDERLRLMSDEGIGLASLLGLASGRYALPANAAPTQLVLMFHGHGNDSCSWRKHLQSVAAKGAVAISMDYTGQVQTPIENYGWCVRAGAADSIAAAKYFMARYPSIRQVFNFSVSMGGNVGGYAVAAAEAKRADGSPLFDYWVVMEGVHDLTQEYGIARSIASANEGAAIAVAEIETENGGTLEEKPEAYAEITNYQRAADMATLKGAVLVHANDDGLVPVVQSRQMWSALNAEGVPSHLYTVGGKGDDEAGTTFTAIPLGPLFGGLGQSYESPLAGHGWEGSDTHVVMKTGFEQLYALMAGGTVAEGETPVAGF